MTMHQDSAYISTRELFGDLCKDGYEAEAKMIELGLLIEGWLNDNSKFKGQVKWVNKFDLYLNPDGTHGFYRFIQEIKETQ